MMHTYGLLIELKVTSLEISVGALLQRELGCGVSVLV